MSLEFFAHSHVPLSRLERVDGTDVVKTTTCYEATRWSISTSHYPARTKRDSMDLVEGGREGGREGERVGEMSYDGVGAVCVSRD